ncbi:Putative carbonic anhydrase-like protein 2 [Toxocara canis]|uniref:Putative carbonic anhydrase-like protein 2 n=1 Tax=Toxocara canis TaxID=6265 RepID=A0A0B2VQ39_TOXCA|nr:Putative carbonic anhydrase-like protein 2 [Toxocara canis]
MMRSWTLTRRTHTNLRTLFDLSILSFILIALSIARVSGDDYPWTYDNDLFGGPDFWGLLDKKWQMCSKGKMQSPINIDPASLLYDPNLSAIHVDKSIVASELINTGQMPRVRIINTIRWPSINISGGPLNPYRYRMQRMDIHYPRGTLSGSEHSIDSKKFPMEIGKKTNEELLKMTIATSSIPFKRKRVELMELRPWKMLPHKADYVTYEGSMTSPGCHETVTWVIVNHPIFITKEDLESWAALQQTITQEAEPRYIAPNFRTLQDPHGRIIRTNIRHRFKENDTECKKRLNDTWYRSNPNRTEAYTRSKAIHRRRHSIKHHSVGDLF